MVVASKWSGIFFALAALTASAAKADLHTYYLTPVGPGGRSVTVHVYELGTKYVVRAEAVQSEGINLAQAARAHRDLPLAVSAGGFGENSGHAGLITLEGTYLSRLATPTNLPTLLCFNPSGFQIRRAAADIGKMLPTIASGCLSAIQAPALLVADGKKLNTSTNPVTWRHVLMAKAASGDRVIIVEGLLSGAALSEFLAGRSTRCTSLVGKVTRQRTPFKIMANGTAIMGCSLGLTDVAILNSGLATGAVHYGTRLSGDAGASPPVAILFDD